MAITNGFKKTKKYRKLSDGNYQLQSEWTSSQTVQMDNGKTLEEQMANLNVSDVSNSTVTYTQASNRTNIDTGEKLSVAFGKIKKYFADLKTVAFTGSYTDLMNIPDNLATTEELDKHVKANDEAKFYFGVLNHKFGYYTTEARDESDFHEFGSAGFHVPPKDVYNVSIKASDGALTVSWNDPDDTYIEGVDISHWAGTILIIKADTPPTDEKDGTVVP